MKLPEIDWFKRENMLSVKVMIIIGKGLVYYVNQFKGSTMKVNSIVVLFLLGFIGPLLPGLSQEDPAIKILSEYHAKLEALSDFSADFIYTIENQGTAANISQKGVLHYAKGKYVIKMPGQEIFCDGKSIWIHLPGDPPTDSELNILPYDPEEGLALDQVFFLFKEKGISAKYVGKQTIAGSSLDLLYLVNTNPKVDFYEARMWINEHSTFPQKITTTDRRQTTTSFEFNNIQLDQGLPATAFEFDTSHFPGEIYDERE